MAQGSADKNMALDEKQKKEINRQKYFTAFALGLMVVVITLTYWMVGQCTQGCIDKQTVRLYNLHI